MQDQRKWNRRAFLRLSGGVASVALLAACQPIVAPAGTIPSAASGTTTITTTVTTTGKGEARFAYVGTYTRGAPGGWSDKAEATHPTGVAVFAVAPETGAFTLIETVPSDNPSYLTLHPTQRYLYVSNEIADYDGQKDAGSIEAYAIDETSGKLTLLNRQAVGSIPAHMSVDPTGKYLVAGIYVGGSFQVLPIKDDGSLDAVSDEVKESGKGPNEARQEAPHPHCVIFDPAGKYIATADLGNDKVQIFQLADGKLVKASEQSVAPGSGPRHLSFHPSGQYLYVICELTATITAFPYDAATGALGDALQVISTVPDDFPPDKSTAEIMVHPSGKFLYGSNRKFEDHPLADAIVGFAIDEATGKLTLIEHTTENIHFPRGFNFDPTGKWLYALNQKGDTIVQLLIDQTTGKLTPTGLIIDTPVPVSIAFKV